MQKISNMAEKHRKRKESKTIKNSTEDTIKIIEIKYRNKIKETPEMMEMIISGIFIKVKSKVKNAEWNLLVKNAQILMLRTQKH